MSGYSFNSMPQPGQKGRGKAFIQKPFTPALLAEIVRQRLDEPAPQAAGVPGIAEG